MMSKTDEAPQSEIEALLPWHAAGTLSRRDAQRVEDALKRDPELARRYDLVREELGETILLNETLGAPSGRAMQNLFAKIDAEPARKPVVSFSISSRIVEFFASLSPRTLAYAGGAAVFAIILQAGLIGGIMYKETRTAGYETASAPATDPASAPSRSSASRRRPPPTTSTASCNRTSCRSSRVRSPAACTRSKSAWPTCQRPNSAKS